MNLDLPAFPIGYSSAPQRARVMSEAWAVSSLFCLDCGEPSLQQFPANSPVADFYCASCGAEYELKSSKTRFGRTLANGAYSKKIERLETDSSPHLVLLNYDLASLQVQNLTAISKHYFRASIIQKRKPLAASARRAGWVGSNILLHLVPMIGRVQMIEDGRVIDKNEVLQNWSKSSFLTKMPPKRRGWLADVLACIEELPEAEFSLKDVYSFENRLKALYPNNKNVRPKIRQQLQVLRDEGLVQFLGNGVYRKSTG